jgi:hypothetical protein
VLGGGIISVLYFLELHVQFLLPQLYDARLVQTFPLATLLLPLLLVAACVPFLAYHHHRVQAAYSAAANLCSRCYLYLAQQLAHPVTSVDAVHHLPASTLSLQDQNQSAPSPSSCILQLTTATVTTEISGIAGRTSDTTQQRLECSEIIRSRSAINNCHRLDSLQTTGTTCLTLHTWIRLGRSSTRRYAQQCIQQLRNARSHLTIAEHLRKSIITLLRAIEHHEATGATLIGRTHAEGVGIPGEWNLTGSSFNAIRGHFHSPSKERLQALHI